MLVHVRRLARYYPSLLLCILLPLIAANSVSAGGGPRNVLVVRNTNSTVSKLIANYYIAQRHIPPENVCDIRASTSESITKAECIDQLIDPIRTFLKNPAIADRIDYIVLTKGIPLSADYGFSSGFLSVASILTCLSEPSVIQPYKNPYGPTALPSMETAFSHKLTLDGKHLYLVTRLDAFTKEDVFRAIDGSLAAIPTGPILLDGQLSTSLSPAYRLLNTRLQKANTILLAKGLPTIYDETPTFLGNCNNLMGYFTWGSNDSSFTSAAYKSNKFLPGSIADTFVSTSARTFSPVTTGQSLIADLIACGACGVSGYVSEPYTNYSTYPDVLFDRYTKGYNMAESFYAATPELYWKSVVVGDPLMAPYSTPPVVSVNAPAEPLTGTDAVITATATDLSGVSKIDFYFDDKYLGTSNTAPFSVVFDTTGYAVGTHRVDVVAYEDSPVATQGMCSAEVSISNPISNLAQIQDAFTSSDGQTVKATTSVVSAGTAELGGEEFYIQNENGIGGMKVISREVVEEGDLVNILGDLTTKDGERGIAASSVEVTNHLLSSLRPLLMNNRSVGGGDICNETKGVTNGKGLRNMGLLIKTYGNVTYAGNQTEPYFYIDDGSHLRDPSGNSGLRVLCHSLTKPLLGSFVAITGISSCFVFDDIVVPAVKTRSIKDIVVVKQQVQQ